MSRPVARAYLKGIQPSFDLPYHITDHVVLLRSTEAPALDEVADDVIREATTCVLDVHGVEDRMALVHVSNAIWGIRLASSCAVRGSDRRSIPSLATFLRRTS